MRIALRADAGPGIGVGHVRRCLSLAKALAGMGAEVVVAGRGACDFDSGIAVRELAADDAATFADAVGAADWVVVDHYGLDAGWHRAIAALTGAQVAVIDDLANRPVACDVLIDQNLRADARDDYAERLEQPARVLSGPRFALIDPAFAEAPPVSVTQDLASIGVFMGGVDAAGATFDVLDALDRCRWRGTVEVVSTSANQALGALADRVHARSGTILSVDLPDLSAFNGRHGLQIGAAGGASWERACSGVPTLAVAVAENQAVVIGPLAAAGAIAAHAAWPIDVALLARQIDALVDDHGRRGELAAAARGLVDGYGALRVAARLLPLTLRDALANDAERAFDWRNAASTRQFSGNPAPIDPAGHRDWWARALSDPARLLWIAMVGNRPAGVLRYDVAGTAAEVSIYLDPLLTGLGLGTELLRIGEKRLADHGVDTVTARIDPGNIASRRSFASAGFVATDGDRYVARLGDARAAR